MYDFILQIFLISSLAATVYLMARALPRVAQNGKDPINFYDYFERWIDKLPIHKFDDRLNLFLSKFLRKTRLLVMKIDARIVHNLGKLKKNGENGNSVRDLINHINSDKKEE
ncbi:MAG: hypothetical protein AAB890_00155 [Patescibacteria group bacterium]